MDVHEGLEEQPIITRPEDEELLAKLERKYTEYRERIGDAYTHPEQGVTMGLAVGSYVPLNAYLKSSLLRRVLDDGEVATWDWTLAFLEEDPIINNLGYDTKAYVADKLDEICGLIDAYCRNDLSEVVGGTGLN